MKKKIAFIITKSNFGGAQRYVFDLATSLPAEDFDVVVILGGEGILKQKLQEKNIRIISLEYLKRDISIKNDFLSFKEFFHIFREERPDIVHGNSSKAGGIAAFIARIVGIKKIVFTAHAWAFNEKRNFLSRSLITFLHWLNIILSHQTIAVSESLKNQVEHFPFIKGKIKVIHLGIAEPEFLSRTNAQHELGIRSKRKALHLGTLAELHPVKGLVYAIDSLSIIRDKDPELFERIDYSILGEGDQKDWLQKHISKRNLEDKVRLLGWKQNAANYLKAFDIFLLPSLSEAFGYVLLEAGMAGIPISASDVGGIPEIIEDGVTGRLFSSGDARAVVRAIYNSLDGPSSQDMAKMLSKKIKGQFSIEQMLSKTIDTYLENS